MISKSTEEDNAEPIFEFAADAAACFDGKYRLSSNLVHLRHLHCSCAPKGTHVCDLLAINVKLEIMMPLFT